MSGESTATTFARDRHRDLPLRRRRARRKLEARHKPRLARLALAMIGDDAEVAAIVERSMAAAWEQHGQDFANTAVRSLVVQCQGRGTTRTGPFARVDVSDTAVLALHGVDFQSFEATASLLGLSTPDVMGRYERALQAIGLEDPTPRCAGWHLVSRLEDLGSMEQKAAAGHLLVCGRCQSGMEQQRQLQGRLVAGLPDPVTVGIGTAATGVVGLLLRPQIAAGIGVAALVAGVLLSGIGRSPDQVESDQPAAAGSSAVPTDVPDASSPASVPEPISDTSPPSSGRIADELSDSTSGAPAVDQSPLTSITSPGPVSGTAPTSVSALIANVDGDYGAERAAVAGFLSDHGYVVVEYGAEPRGKDAFLSALTRATEVGPGTAVVHLLLTASTTVDGTASVDVGGALVSADEIGAALTPNRRAVVILDLDGLTGTSLQAFSDAVAGPQRIVVAALSPDRPADADPLPSAQTGYTAFGDTFWRASLLGGAGDANLDGRVSVEEAAAEAARVAVQTSVASRPVMNDQIDGEVYLTS